MARRVSIAALLLLLPFCAALPARAQVLSDDEVEPFMTSIGDYDFTLGGSANGGAYASSQPESRYATRDGVTGAAFADLKLERIADSGLVYTLNGTFELYHDTLTGDIYGNHVLEKLWFGLQTGLGRIEIGDTDGAAYAFAITGPSVDSDVALDAANESFFRDPVTGHSVRAIFPLSVADDAALNYAKIGLYSPRLFGLELGVSFAPTQSRNVLPFAGGSPGVADRADHIVDVAADYTDREGAFSYAVSGAASFAGNGAQTPAHQGLTDWALGAEVDYNVGDGVKLGVGGGFRQTNAYALDIDQALIGAETRVYRLSGTIAYGAWIVGGEYESGQAEGNTTLPSLSVTGYEPSVGYKLNDNLQLTLGWQHLDYTRGFGAFYNGAPHLPLEAGFLHLKFHV